MFRKPLWALIFFAGIGLANNAFAGGRCCAPAVRQNVVQSQSLVQTQSFMSVPVQMSYAPVATQSFAYTPVTTQAFTPVTTQSFSYTPVTTQSLTYTPITNQSFVAPAQQNLTLQRLRIVDSNQGASNQGLGKVAGGGSKLTNDCGGRASTQGFISEIKSIIELSKAIKELFPSQPAPAPAAGGEFSAAQIQRIREIVREEIKKAPPKGGNGGNGGFDKVPLNGAFNRPSGFGAVANQQKMEVKIDREELAEVMRDVLKKELDPIKARIAALEKK